MEKVIAVLQVVVALLGLLALVLVSGYMWAVIGSLLDA